MKYAISSEIRDQTSKYTSKVVFESPADANHAIVLFLNENFKITIGTKINAEEMFCLWSVFIEKKNTQWNSAYSLHEMEFRHRITSILAALSKDDTNHTSYKFLTLYKPQKQMIFYNKPNFFNLALLPNSPLIPPTPSGINHNPPPVSSNALNQANFTSLENVNLNNSGSENASRIRNYQFERVSQPPKETHRTYDGSGSQQSHESTNHFRNWNWRGRESLPFFPEKHHQTLDRDPLVPEHWTNFRNQSQNGNWQGRNPRSFLEKRYRSYDTWFPEPGRYNSWKKTGSEAVTSRTGNQAKQSIVPVERIDEHGSNDSNSLFR